MFAAILRNADGSFAVARFAILLVGAAMALGTLFYFLPAAIRTGRIPAAVGQGLSRTGYIERDKSPVYFWFMFVGYSLLIPLGLYIVYKACVGPGHGLL